MNNSSGHLWQSQGDFRLGGWLVQPSLNRLSRQGRTVHVEPKLMDVLVFLASRPGEVTSKEELLEAVWGRPYIAESVLSRAIAELRRALDDNAAAPDIVETIRKRGYRVIAAVEAVGAPTGNDGAGKVPDAPVGAGEAPVVLVWGQRELPFSVGSFVIGRAADAALRLRTPRASRHHARLTVGECHVSLEDLGSKNGTFVRGSRITLPTELVDGDDVTIGGEVFIVRLSVSSGTTLTDAGD